MFHERASRYQAQLYKVIAGAVINTVHAHPKWKIDKRFARSIAKRAAGTLSAQWPEVLAVEPSDSDRIAFVKPVAPDLRAYDARKLGLCERLVNSHNGRVSHVRHSPILKRLKKTVGRMAGDARRDGLPERTSAIIDVLRLIDALQAVENSSKKKPD